jgi:hypothetical protein
VASAAVALSSGGVLGLAAWLEPSANGHSTHTQLGLDPCTFLTWTGWPCPMCGATTSWALLAHGRPVEAVWNQPFASLLFLVAVGTFAVATAEAVWPRGRWTRLSAAIEPHEGTIGATLLVGMIAGWIWKIALMW